LRLRRPERVERVKRALWLKRARRRQSRLKLKNPDKLKRKRMRPPSRSVKGFVQPCDGRRLQRVKIDGIYRIYGIERSCEFRLFSRIAMRTKPGRHQQSKEI